MPSFQAIDDTPAAELPIDQLDDVLEQARAALGPRASSARIRTTEVVRIQYSSGQSVSRGAPPQEISRTRARVGWAPDTRRISAVFRHRPVYPYPFPSDFSFEEEMVAGRCGRIVGADEFRGAKKRTMTAGRVAMREKQQFVTSPHEVLLAATTAQSLSRQADVWQASFIWRGTKMTARISAESGRLDTVEYIEDDPLFGDSRVRVRYFDWKATPLGTVEPTKITHEVDDRLVQVDHIVGRSLDPPEISKRCKKLALPETASAGRARARWQMMWIGYGAPQDLVATSSKIKFTAVAEGVHMIEGSYHNSMLIELGDNELFLVEAPSSPHQTEAVFAHIGKRWPDASVVGVAQTHWHHDHNGGMRPIIAREIPVYAGPVGATLIEEVSRRPRTLPPDALSARSVVAEIRLVHQATIVEGSQRSVELIPVDSLHVDGMFVVYMRDAKILFNADLLNPGLVPTRGLRGWFVRNLIKTTVPFTLVKAGTYALDLKPLLKELDVQGIVGGHGPEVADPKDAAHLMRFGDPERFHSLIEEHGQLD